MHCARGFDTTGATPNTPASEVAATFQRVGSSALTFQGGIGMGTEVTVVGQRLNGSLMRPS